MPLRSGPLADSSEDGKKSFISSNSSAEDDYILLLVDGKKVVQEEIVKELAFREEIVARALILHVLLQAL